MTDDRSLERAARSWIDAGPTRAPERVIEGALLKVQTTGQERELRIPWRLPAMLTPTRLAAAAVIGALVLGGAIIMSAGSKPNVVTPTPSVEASPSSGPSAQGPTLATYKADRDGICGPATQQVVVLNEKAALLDPTTRPGDTARMVVNLTQVVGVATDATDALALLRPPSFAATDHAADVTRHRDSIAILSRAIAKLQAGEVAAGLAMTDATEPISVLERAFEQKYGLAGCP
jgi:hypothetical protein